MDLALKEEFLIHLIFVSLPKEFDTFVVNYNIQPEKWDLERLMAMCVQEEERMKAVNGGTINYLKDNKKKNNVGVSDQGVLNQLVNVNCMPLISDGDAKRHKVYTSSGNWCLTSSLRDRPCIPCTEVLVVGGYKLGERES